MMKRGCWWVTSKLDPRWDGQGDSDAVGMFGMPWEAKRHLERRKEELGEDPPEDCEWGYMKD